LGVVLPLRCITLCKQQTVQQHGAVAVRRGQRVTAKARLHNGLITRRVGDKYAGDAASRRNSLTTCLLSSWVEDSHDESAAAVLLYDYFEPVSPSQTLIFLTSPSSVCSPLSSSITPSLFHLQLETVSSHCTCRLAFSLTTDSVRALVLYPIRFCF